MLRKLFRRLTYANVMSTIAVFGVLAGGTAYAANEWTGANIVDGSLTGADVYDNTISGNDITNNSVASADVKDQSLTTFDVSTILGADVVDGTLTGADVGNGSLKDEDIAKTALVDLPIDVGIVPAHSCTTFPINGIGGPGNHLLLSPAYEDTSIFLTYTIFTPRINTSHDAYLQVCNPTDNAQSGGPTSHFNLLVIDAH